MNKFFKTSTNGKSDREMQLCQRAAPTGGNEEIEDGDYVSHSLFQEVPYQLRYTNQCRHEELERQKHDWRKDLHRSSYSHAKENWYVKKVRGKTRDLRRERLSQRAPCFEKHSGLEFANLHTMVSDLAKYASVDYTDELLIQLEGVVALIFTLQGCQDYVTMSSALFLYIRKFFDKSVTSHVMEYISDLFETEPQSDGESVDVVQSTDWVEMMRNLRDNWAVVRENKLFSHFSKLLGLLVTAELCKVSDLTFSVKEFKIWEPDMKVVHGSAVDIFDAALSTVTFFVENISLCWQEQSLRPFLVNDKAAIALDEEYTNVVLWWDLVKNGNLKRVADKSEHEFDRRLEDLTTKIKNLSGGLKSFDKKLMDQKLVRLLKIKNDYITLKICSGVKQAPFCIEFFGASSQGKTTCCNQVLTALLTSAGLPTGKQYQATYNASDKFMSTWSTDKLVLVIDDMANDKSNFVERPPTRVIIDVANNSPMYANMADLDRKGKVFVEPAICAVTTNVKDLDARIYSNCPYSIQRRMHIVVTVRAKEYLQRTVDGRSQGLDPYLVKKHVEANPDAPFDDFWWLTLERAVRPENLTSAATYAPIVFRGKEMVDISFKEALQCMIEYYEIHRDQQEGLITRMKKMEEVEICGVNGCCQLKHMCDLHDGCRVIEEVEKQFGDEIVSSLESAGSMISRRIKSDIFGLDRAVESACTFAIMGAAKKFVKHWDWLKLVPTPWLQNNKFQNLMMLLYRDDMKKNYIKRTTLLWSSIFGVMFLARNQPRQLTSTLGAGLITSGITMQKCMVRSVKAQFHRSLVDRNTITTVLGEYRDRHVEKICKACAIVGALYGISRVYKAWRKLRPQGSLEPRTPEEVRERDAETNVWSAVVPRHLPVNPLTANATSEQLIGLVEKNLFYGSVTVGDRVLRVNGLFLTSNVVVIPDHYFEKDVIDVKFKRFKPKASSGEFSMRLSVAQSVKLPNTDLRVCFAASGGSFKDIRKYLFDGDLPPTEFALRWRDMSGELVNASGIACRQLISNGACEFEGYYYQSLTIDTFKGMCGATLVAKRRPIILGVHLGGKSGTPRGCAGMLPRSIVNKAIDDLRTIDGVIISGSAEKFETQVLGVNVLVDKELHPKSPLNYMPEGSQVSYFGTCPGMSVFKSDVRVTPISEHIMDVTGQPNIFGPPVVEPQYYGWQNCLANLALPASPYDPELLILAIKDYKEDMLGIFKNPMWKNASPLDDESNLCGIPGIKFIDAIKLDTSIGYPLGGCKRRFVTELPPTEDRPSRRVFDDVIVNEIARCLDCYKRGERAYVINRACKKDEVLSKKKCRIFYGSGIALIFLVRKYFLPILRVMQFNPKVSECAVGVNCHGPEWQELHDHIFTFGKDRLIGGDYGKYDQKLPSQLIFAALRIMIDFARECDYSQEDLEVMEAMTGDIVYAIIAYNGDLIGLTEGTHISGNSLTVIINGICGSLNLRCYFYKENPCASFDERMKFREFVKLITYGDDNIGSVSDLVNNFTIKGASQFLAEYGQTYTMPDKESELLDFLPPEEFEFLKRKSVYLPEIGQHVGALVDLSCFKMLHCFIRTKNSPLTKEHASAQNIDTALREWFNHGQDTYETRREQMKEVANRAGIAHLCSELDVTYADCVERWKAKYDKNYHPSYAMDEESIIKCFDE